MHPSSFPSLPLVDLHLHLLGAVPLDLLESWLGRTSFSELRSRIPKRAWKAMLRLPKFRHLLSGDDTPPLAIGQLLQYANFSDFMLTYLFIARLVRSEDDFEHLVSGVLASLEENQVSHAEIIVSLPTYLQSGLSLKSCLQALRRNQAQHTGSVLWVLDPIKDLGPKAATDLLSEILLTDDQVFSAVNLGGNEGSHPTRDFSDFYALARACKLGLAAHAGEQKGPESVWHAIEHLGVSRVGHGIRAVEDQTLLRRLREDKIALEICISSNIRTGLVADLQSHPIRRLLDAGVEVVICTDDPSLFGTTLRSERELFEEIVIDQALSMSIWLNSIRHSFLDEKDQQSLLRRASIKQESRC